MSTVPVAAPASLRDLAAGFPRWLATSLPAAAVSAVAAGVFGYLSNIWIMAVKYGGTNDVPAGSPATSSGNFFGGALFWALASSTAFGVIGYRRAAGRERFWREVRALPGVLLGLVRREGAPGRVQLLWGVAVALLAGLVLPPAVGAVTALAVLATVPGILGSIVGSALSRAWSGLLRPLAPSAKPVGVEAVTVSLIGGGLALTAGFVIAERGVRLALAAAAAVAALALGSHRRPPRGAAALLVAVGASLVQVVLMRKAGADDGAYPECGSDLMKWLRDCQGSAEIRRNGVVGALAAAVPAPFGLFVGSLLGQLPPDWGGLERPGRPEPGNDVDDVADELLRDVDPNISREWLADSWRVPETIGEPAWLFDGRPRPTDDLGWVSVEADEGLLLRAPYDSTGRVSGPWTTDRPPGNEGTDWNPFLDPAFWDEVIEAANADPFTPPPPQPPAGLAMPSAEELARRFEDINRWNFTTGDPDGMSRRIDAFFASVRDEFGPDQLRELEAIEALQGGASAAHLGAVLDAQLTSSAGHLQGRSQVLQHEADTERWSRQVGDALAEHMDRNEAYVRNHISDLPVSQQDAAERTLERLNSRVNELIAQGGAPDAQTLAMIRTLTGSVFNTTQGGSEHDEATAAVDAAAAGLGENLSRAAQLGLIGGVAGGAIMMAVGAVPTATLTGAQLGASLYGFGITTGAAEGYGSGERYAGETYIGVEGAMVGAIRNALPVNLVHQVHEELTAPDGSTSTVGEVGRILFATVRDIGNVAGFSDLLDTAPAMMSAARGLGEGAGEAASARIQTGPRRPPGELSPVDRAFEAAQARGQHLADGFADAAANLRRAEHVGDPAAIAVAQQQVRNRAIDIASDYNGKNTLKNSSAPLQGAYAEAMEPVFQSSTQRMVEALNREGYQMGGRAMRVDDFLDLRNAASRGSVPMDRDLALNQMVARGLRTELDSINPRSTNEVDAFLRSHLQEQLTRIEQQSQLTRHGERISPGNASADFNRAYNGGYGDVTEGLTGIRYDGRSALQEVTHSTHGEAYADLNVIRNSLTEHPLNVRVAEQTGSVTPYKAYENLHSPGLGADDATRQANALLETARGTVKDINTKIEPVLAASGASPAAIARTHEVRDFLADVSRGEYYPSQAERLAQERFGTGITGLAEQMGSNLAAAVAHGPTGMRPPPPRGIEAWNVAAGTQTGTGLFTTPSSAGEIDGKH